jgi:hypothetical protein
MEEPNLGAKEGARLIDQYRLPFLKRCLIFN